MITTKREASMVKVKYGYLRRAWGVLGVVLVVTGVWSAAQETDPTDGKAAYRFEEIADDVWFAVGLSLIHI